MTHRSDPAQAGLFELTRRDPDPGLPEWSFPCGLCNAFEVDEAGGLCETCAPIPFRKPVRRRTTAKTVKATMQTAAPARHAAQDHAAQDHRPPVGLWSCWSAWSWGWSLWLRRRRSGMRRSGSAWPR